MATTIILWILFAILAALYGDNRKLGFGWTLLISIILSPLLGFIIAAASGKKIPKDNADGLLNNIEADINNGKLTEAKEKCLTLIKAHPNNAPNSCFHIACIYAQERDKEGALFYLKKALQSGYSDLNAIRSSGSLADLRQTDEYRSMMKTFIS